jgi:hypothetical protein
MATPLEERFGNPAFAAKAKSYPGAMLSIPDRFQPVYHCPS